MADVFSKSKRSAVMALIRSMNTKPEIAFRELIGAAAYPKGFRYRLHYRRVPGMPDIAFVSKKVAIFIDGSFWHGYKLRTGKQRLSKKYWLPKIEGNISRDRSINRQLRNKGWIVIRIWEHDLRKKPQEALAKVGRALGSHF